VYDEMIERAAEKGKNNLLGQLDMFSVLGDTQAAPRVEYPDIPEFGVREKLLMEKEATGMYFSGQMLDEYSKHVALLKPDSIADFVGEDCDPVDKQRVSVAGIVTAVTTKNTRNGERMAFFTVEDRMAEIECIAFARMYADASHLLHNDSGVFVSGSLSLREDEPPKLLVNRIEALVEDARFRPEEHQAQPVQEKRDERRTQNTATKRQAMPEKREDSAPKRLFLRVPSEKSREFYKTLNLVELFEGDFPAFFYFADEKQYDTGGHGIALSDYVLRQLRELLGEENVILK
jgi:DNA polymerase-3 subunit alpha